jgi:hypothetical protein
MKRLSRKAATKGRAARKAPLRLARYPYALPRLFDGSTAASGEHLEMCCRSAIRAAWEAGERGNVKAARDDIARFRLTPATIAAVARSLADYNCNGNWPHGEDAQKADWLSTGAGCCERFGTVRDAHLAAWSALSAALSIIVDVPITRRSSARSLPRTSVGSSAAICCYCSSFSQNK